MNLELMKTFNPSLYTDDELIQVRNNLEIEYGKIDEDWLEGVKYVADENFDPYSPSGERKMKKYNKKYADKASDILMYIDLINVEISKREKLKEEQRYSGKSNFSYGNVGVDEFIEKESDKTFLHRQKIDTDEE